MILVCFSKISLVRDLFWAKLPRKGTGSIQIIQSAPAELLGPTYPIQSLVQNNSVTLNNIFNRFAPAVVLDLNTASKRPEHLVIRILSADPDQRLSWLTTECEDMNVYSIQLLME